MNKTKSVLIVAPIKCPNKTNHADADSARANLLTNGRIYCIFCGTSPEAVAEDSARALEALVSATCQAVEKCTGQPAYHRGFPNNLTGCEAQGIDFKNLETVTYSFPPSGHVTSANVEYYVTELPYAAEADVDYGTTLSDAEKGQLDDAVVEAVAALEKMGFRVNGEDRGLHPDQVGGHHLCLTRGTPVGKMGYVLGIRVRFKVRLRTAS